MINDVQNIKSIKSIEELKDLINIIIQKYGSVISIRVIDNNDFYERYHSIEELNNSVIDFNNTKEIDVTISTQKDLLIGLIDLNNNTMTVRNVNRENIEYKEPDVIDDPTLFIDDEECYYYQFENGSVVKYNQLTGQYFILDKTKGWSLNNNVVSWVHDNNFEYKVIHSPGKGMIK